MLRVLASGQSNMLGRIAGGPDWSDIDSRVTVWDNVNPLGADGTAFVTPATARAGGTFDNTDRNNLAVWFCHRLARHIDDDVRLTIVAEGATLIEEWITSDDNSAPLRDEIANVFVAQGGGDPYDIFIWHQGEGAVFGDYPTYQAHFAEMVSLLTNDGVIGPRTTIIVGGTAEENLNRINFNREALQQIAAAEPRTFYAPSNGLRTAEGTHFDGPSLYSFGAERYFGAYLQAERNLMDIWALVNEGGTPGTPGSGTNKVANLASLLQDGFRRKGEPVVLTTDQTYTPSEGTIAIEVHAQGPGGGGAGASSGSATARPASGGGAGGYAKRWIENPEASYDVEIGLGGAGGAAGQNNGSAGSKATTFGLVLSCAAGSGGASSGSTSATLIVNGGVGGAATGGDVNLSGGRGRAGIKLDANGTRMAGGGANSPMGTGGQDQGTSSSTSSVDGQAASGWGAGGAGGVSGTGTDAAGGAGANGVVFVYEYQRG